MVGFFQDDYHHRANLKFCGHHDLVDRYGISVTNDHGYVPLVINTSRSFPRSWLITGFVTRLTRRVSLVKQELLTIPEHLSSPPVFSGVRVIRSLVLYVCFVDHCLSLWTFPFGHCIVCSSSIYGFWLSLWYLQTLLTHLAGPLQNVCFCVDRKSKMDTTTIVCVIL